MIYITNKPPQWSSDIITVMNKQQGKEAIAAFYVRISKNQEIGLDTETNGLDPHANQVLLAIIGDEIEQFVIDTTTVPLLEVLPEQWNDYYYIAHNAKFDYKMLKVQLKMNIEHLYCTMLIEQKIHQGLLITATNPTGISAALKATIKRRFNEVPLSMNKDTRLEFVGIKPANFNPLRHQIEYAAGDIVYLSRIKAEQTVQVEQYELSFYVNEILLPLMKVVADMEIEGQVLDTKRWIANIEANEDLLYEASVALDKELIRLRDTVLTPDERYYLIGGKFTRPRNKPLKTANYSLFGDLPTTTTKEKKNISNINWNSSTQLINIFARLKCIVPVKEHRYCNYAVPTLIRKVKAKGDVYYKVDTNFKYTASKDYIEAMAIERPDLPTNELLNMLVEYRHILHNISAFGKNFIENISSITGKIHSLYRTETAITGRFQSGDSKNGYFNSQNIPRDKEIRACFSAGPDYSITTCDLSGAEVTIICDKAHDQQLYEWAVINDDAHSPIATKCWRAVYHYRAGMMAGFWKDAKTYFKIGHYQEIDEKLMYNPIEEVRHLYTLSKNFIIDKQNNKGLRVQFKPMTFGTVYGMFAKKGAKTLNIHEQEAEVVITTIKNSIPATFKYVENNVQSALQNGYIILDERTNSRIWFPDVMRSIRDDIDMDWSVISSVEGVARNSPFQGTQAAMVKEAMVEIHTYFKYHNIDAAIINMVHDELVIRQPKEYDGINGTKTVRWYSDDAKRKANKYRSVIQPLDTKTIWIELEKVLKYEDVSIPDFVKLTMCEAANRYLTHYKMGADVTVLDTWTK